MDENTIKENFLNIEEGDLVDVKFEGYQEFTKEAEIVSGEGKDKIVSFMIPQTEPKLVFVRGKVRLEQRPLGRSREWSQYLKVDSLKLENDGDS